MNYQIYFLQSLYNERLIQQGFINNFNLIVRFYKLKYFDF